CIRCVSIKPLVDDLELELGDQIHIIRLNVQEQVGMELSPVYGFEFTPTFIYFDSAGNEIWRTIGDFNPQQVRDTIANE
ncbi:MAG: thioredoxin family protein, partial [Anaerolineae bacterium]|nr:thioredoxin family protein [Anaerolineae bacterium]